MSICAVRDVKDHADRFWAIALAKRASDGQTESGPIRSFAAGGERMKAKHERSCAGV